MSLIPRLVDVGHRFAWAQGVPTSAGGLDWLPALPREARLESPDRMARSSAAATGRARTSSVTSAASVDRGGQPTSVMAWTPADEWIQLKAGTGCVMCADIHLDENEFSYKVAEFDHTYVRLPKNPNRGADHGIIADAWCGGTLSLSTAARPVVRSKKGRQPGGPRWARRPWDRRPRDLPHPHSLGQQAQGITTAFGNHRQIARWCPNSERFPCCPQ
jgi:hypothetical protein